MRNEIFGAIAAALPERDVAKVLLIASLKPSRLRACLRNQRDIYEWSDQARDILSSLLPDPYSNAIPLQLNLQSIRSFARAVSDSPRELRSLCNMLPVLWKDTFAHYGGYRVTLRRPGRQLDLQWIARMLTSSGIGVESVVNEVRHEVEYFWEWPLRIGVLPTPSGEELLNALKDDRCSELYDVNMATASGSMFDLLLFSGSLAEMAKIEIPAMRVGALLILGGAETNRDAVTDLLRSQLYWNNRASMVALCFVPTEERMPWLRTVVRELTHNATLDTALFKAHLVSERQSEGAQAGSIDLPPPLVFAGEDFLQGARIVETAKRIGMVLQKHDMAEQEVTLDDVPGTLGKTVGTLRDVGTKLLHDASSYMWNRESGDATSLVRMRHQIETNIGSLEIMPIVVSDYSKVYERQGVGYGYKDRRAEQLGEAPERPQFLQRMAAFDLLKDSSPAASVSAPSVEERYVQCKVTQGIANEESIKRLEPNEVYLARIHVGSRTDESQIVASEGFDEARLPASEQGHDLDIVFCPLVSEANKFASPLVQRVHLPTHGDSGMAEFYFASGTEPDNFRARVIILHRNRIIQTLCLRVPEPGQELVFDPENMVEPFESISKIEKAADLAFVINDNLSGKPGITTVSSDTASFIEPAGLDQSIGTIKKLLSRMNVSTVGTVPKLDDEGMVSLMIDLANHGAAILREIKNQLPIAPYQSAVRVQVVEAVANAYLPVEFLYSGKAPNPGAKLCPNATAVLRNGEATEHQNCAHAEDPDYVCPAAFWGFSKCIERQPFGLTTAHVFSVPQQGAEELTPFDTAVVSASKRVDKDDMTGPSGLVTKMKSVVANQLRSAASWKDWRDKVQDAPSPTLLVLLPHSANSPVVTNMPALEIADSWLESSRLDEDYVHPEKSVGPGPLVLLLGCSTALTEIAFLNFVREFKRSGASIVLGTLATIHGKQAVSFALRLLDEMKKQGNGNPFDQTLLKVKQQLLADGEPFVLSLASYGHSSWLIKS